MTQQNNRSYVQKLATGIAGFDLISKGGLPKGRTTLVTGTTGSAKTLFAAQFLAEGVQKTGEHGVFVTFGESPDDLRKNLASLNWPIEEWEREGKWAFVEATPQLPETSATAGSFDFGDLISRIKHAIRKVGARRVSVDALGAMFAQFADGANIRSEVLKIVAVLKKMGTTAVLTVERNQEYGEVAAYRVAEFVADNVVILRNALEDEKRRQTLEILKFRGASHHRGEFPITIMPGHGIVVIPYSVIELKQKSSVMRITSGNPELDRMCGGGFFRDSIILVSGATGTGKTLMQTKFLAAGPANDERCLLFAFEESREQLFRNAFGWGVDFERMEKQGKLRVVCHYPEAAGLENHFVKMMTAIDEYKPSRVVVDSMSALERISTVKSFREFAIGLASFLKHQEIAGLLTATTPTLIGGSSVTDAHLYAISDCIILLRYVELYGEMRRAITVLKMRGSTHDKEIREFIIDGSGAHIGKPFRMISGILAGTPVYVARDELKRMDELFAENNPM